MIWSNPMKPNEPAMQNDPRVEVVANEITLTVAGAKLDEYACREDAINLAKRCLAAADAATPSPWRPGGIATFTGSGVTYDPPASALAGALDCAVAIRDEYRQQRRDALDQVELWAAQGDLKEVSINSTTAERHGAALLACNRIIAILESASSPPLPEQEARPMTAKHTPLPWETFCDESYFHLWRVRKTTWRGFEEGFHVQTQEEGEGLRDLLNQHCVENARLKSENAALNAIHAGDMAVIDQQSERIEELEADLNRIHDALMDPSRPRQAVGEMAAFALAKAKGGA